MKKGFFVEITLGDLKSVKLSIIGIFKKHLVIGTFNALLVLLYDNSFRSIIDMNF